MNRSSLWCCVALILAFGCDEPVEPTSRTNRGATEPAVQNLRLRPLTKSELPTTHHRIYEANFEGQLSALREQNSSPNRSSGLRIELAKMLSRRFSYFGSHDDLTEARRELDEVLHADPLNGVALLAAAEVALSEHAFDRASQFHRRAEAAGMDERDLIRIQIELDWAAGRWTKAARAIRSQSEKAPSVGSLVRHAVLEHEVGDRQLGDRLFERAEDQITSTNPYTVAWLNFQRGRSVLDGGDPERAIPFLRESVLRFPSHRASKMHLAEALEITSKENEAKFYYSELSANGDPEALAGLARLAPGSESNLLQNRARRGFEELLAEHPSESVHASLFFSEIGAHERARTLLENQILAAPNATNYLHLARVQLSAGLIDDAEHSLKLSHQGSLTPHAYVSVCESLRQLQGQCEAR